MSTDVLGAHPDGTVLTHSCPAPRRRPSSTSDAALDRACAAGHGCRSAGRRVRLGLGAAMTVNELSGRAVGGSWPYSVSMSVSLWVW